MHNKKTKKVYITSDGSDLMIFGNMVSFLTFGSIFYNVVVYHLKYIQLTPVFGFFKNVF